MGRFNSIQDYHKAWTARANAIKRNGKKAENAAANFVAARARSYAPRKSGRLLQGIRVRKNIVSFRATGNQGFPYIHWVNQTEGRGLVTVRMKRNKATGKFAKVRVLSPTDGPIFNATYGLQPSGWAWSGKAGFIKLAVGEGRQHFKNLAVKALRKSIQVTT